jgi:hypothetical protein
MASHLSFDLVLMQIFELPLQLSQPRPRTIGLCLLLLEAPRHFSKKPTHHRFETLSSMGYELK